VAPQPMAAEATPEPAAAEGPEPAPAEPAAETMVTAEWWFGPSASAAPPPEPAPPPPPPEPAPPAPAPVRALAERLSAEGREALARIEAQLAALDRLELAKRSLEWHEAHSTRDQPEDPS
jgi:hypothetical protein